MRHTWMDTVRGGSILLIILLHAVALPVIMVGIVPPQWVNDVNTFFVPFRMPSLMLLSGMLLERALRKPLGAYYLGKVRTLVWPYLIWVSIYWFAVDQEEWKSWEGWIATSWLWFIFYLFFYYAAAPLLRRVPPLLVFTACWLGSVFAPNGGWTDLLFYAGFFFAGHAIWTSRSRLQRLDTARVALIAGAIGLGFSIVHLAEAHGRVLPLPLYREWLVYVPFTLSGILAIIYVARRLPDSSTAALRFLGRDSVVFYVVHYPLQLVILRVLASYWIWDWWIYLVLGLLLPLGIGVVLAKARHRSRIVSALFVMPWPQRVAATR